MLVKQNSKIIYQNGKRPNCLLGVCNSFSKYIQKKKKGTFYRVRRSKGLGSSGICRAGSNASGR